jgi:hypothetical protein
VQRDAKLGGWIGPLNHPGLRADIDKAWFAGCTDARAVENPPPTPGPRPGPAYPRADRRGPIIRKFWPASGLFPVNE